MAAAFIVVDNLSPRKFIQIMICSKKKKCIILGMRGNN